LQFTAIVFHNIEADMEPETFTGTVIFFSSKLNFGFIKRENLPDLFFHFSDIEMQGYKFLDKEDVVKYSLGVNHHGQPKAINIQKISSGKAVPLKKA